MHSTVAHEHVATEPCEAPARRPSLRSVGIAGAAVAAGTAAIAAINPTDSGVPVCWSQGVFGVDCPLCGGLRCVNSLARGDFAAAADHNVLLAIALPVVVIGWLVWMVSAASGRPLTLPRVPTWLQVSGVVLLIAFSVVRNIDAGGWVGWLHSTAT